MDFLLSFLIMINILSVIIMFLDKNNAKRQKQRVSEATLFFFGFLGGSLGLLIGMYIFRHKTKHLKFTLGIPILLLVNLAFYVLISSHI